MENREVETTKVKISKADFFCHLFTLVALIIFGTICATTQLIYNTAEMVTNSPSLGRLNKLLENNLDGAINKLEMMVDFNRTSPKSIEDCNYFLAPSVIPNSGIGLYAGMSVAEGEQITLMTNEKQFHIDSSDMAYILLHLKHHQISNVKISDKHDGENKFSKKTTSFVASKQILVGEELLFDTADLENKFNSMSLMDTYHGKLFPKAPVRETYVKADKLLAKINKYIRDNEDNAKRVKSGRHMISQLWNGPILKLVKHVVSLHDEVVGSLFPENLVNWSRAMSLGIASSVVTKKRLRWLHQNALCVDELKLEQSTISNNKKGIFLTRDVATGDVILSTPISVFKYEEGSELSKFCFHPLNTDILVCPLRFLGFVNHAFTSKRQGYNEECTNGANAYYRWSLENDSEKKIHDLSTDELLQNTQTELTIDYVATRDIKEGEELTIDYGNSWEKALDDHHNDINKNSGSFHRPMEFKEKLVPNSWTKNNRS